MLQHNKLQRSHRGYSRPRRSWQQSRRLQSESTLCYWTFDYTIHSFKPQNQKISWRNRPMPPGAMPSQVMSAIPRGTLRIKDDSLPGLWSCPLEGSRQTRSTNPQMHCSQTSTKSNHLALVRLLDLLDIALLGSAWSIWLTFSLRQGSPLLCAKALDKDTAPGTNLMYPASGVMASTPWWQAG